VVGHTGKQACTIKCIYVISPNAADTKNVDSLQNKFEIRLKKKVVRDMWMVKGFIDNIEGITFWISSSVMANNLFFFVSIL
jgi:hypothetical protein